jgi:hypothetical protein
MGSRCGWVKKMKKKAGIEKGLDDDVEIKERLKEMEKDRGNGNAKDILIRNMKDMWEGLKEEKSELTNVKVSKLYLVLLLFFLRRMLM